MRQETKEDIRQERELILERIAKVQAALTESVRNEKISRYDSSDRHAELGKLITSLAEFDYAVSKIFSPKE